MTQITLMTPEMVEQQEYDIEKIRQDFPILSQQVKGKPLVYLDNAATSQKPKQVIDTLSNYYEEYNANIHRGVHTLSEKATHEYEKARVKIQQFVNAKQASEIIFVRGTTEGINLIAQTYGRQNLQTGDEVVITAMEHHSNIVPWQMLCEQTGAKLRVAPINTNGEVILEEYEKLLSAKTKIVSVVHISNALGTINPIKEMIAMAHQQGAKVVIDGAQSAPHTKIDVQDLDCDFYTISGHKMYGPTGIGAVYGKFELLDAMPPYQGGGEMIRMVSFEKTVYNDVPHKYEAGTPNIAGSIALGSAIDYISSIGLDNIARYEHLLIEYATKLAEHESDLRIIGTAKHKTSILSFVLENIHAHDIGTILDTQGVAVRTGHHCAMPVMQFYNVPATTRASFAMYNTIEEIDQLFAGLKQVKEVFAK
jgi:cysteine desulfurase/selenocysteine lyase